MKKYSIPKGIEKEAAEYIQGVLAELENRGVLENIDNAALDMLARNYSTFIKASKQLEIDGLTVTSDRGNIATSIGKSCKGCTNTGYESYVGIWTDSQSTYQITKDG